MSTFVERYKNEGKLEGLQIGKQEGKQEERIQILLRLLSSHPEILNFRIRK